MTDSIFVDWGTDHGCSVLGVHHLSCKGHVDTCAGNAGKGCPDMLPMLLGTKHFIPFHFFFLSFNYHGILLGPNEQHYYTELKIILFSSKHIRQVNHGYLNKILFTNIIYVH